MQHLPAADQQFAQASSVDSVARHKDTPGRGQKAELSPSTAQHYTEEGDRKEEKLNFQIPAPKTEPFSAAALNTQPKVAKFCTECGCQFHSASDKFCGSCGHRRKA